MNRFTERLPLLPHKPFIQYGLTLLMCLVALWVRWAADSTFPPGYPFVSFFPAVIVSSFLFGARCGAAAGVLCGLFAWFLFIPPVMIMGSYRGPVIAMLFYSGVVAIDIALVHLMQAANARLRDAREDVRRLAEERGQLIERAQILFQELQHRVGNNLQMVGAVLSLQMRSVAEPEAKKALSDAAARLQVMGNIQRRLYQQDGALVPLDTFIEEVSAKIMAASALPGFSCTVHAEPDIVMRPDSVVPIALVMAEAITNALEHGFAGRFEGAIVITVRRAGEDVLLMVEDDGTGLPAGFDASIANSIGMRISRVLAQQLAARHTLENRQGAGARMTLQVPSSRLAAPN